MKAAMKWVLAGSVTTALFSATAGAASWQDQLNSAASALGQNNAAAPPIPPVLTQRLRVTRWVR